MAGTGPGHRQHRPWEAMLDLAALDLLGQPLDDVGDLLELGMDRQRAAERFERGLVVAEFLHDGAEPGERPEMARLARQHLADIRNRAAIVFGVEEDGGAAVPSLNVVRLE